MDVLPPDHIRLLLIEPGVDSLIRCRLLTTSLDTAPPYEALSYNWGPLTQNCVVTCDDRPSFVTQNLYDAIQHLRRPNLERLMWIDMICIDQSNHKERSDQVEIMSHIFSKAVRVIIWLGIEAADDKAAFGLLDIFEDNFKEHGTWNIDFALLRGIPNLDDPRWIALANLYRRPYFSRIWVAQEIVMAREIAVAYGSVLLEWDVLSNVAQILVRSARIGPYSPSYVVGVFTTFIMNLLKDAQKSQDTTWTLYALLRLTRRFKATDVRDKVFAVIGMVINSGSVGIAVDYGLTAEEVFTRVAIYELEALKNLEILASAGTAQNLKVPSWVADWSYSEFGRVIAAVGNSAKMSAAADSTPILSISPDKTILMVRGAIIDSITQINDTNIPNVLDHSSEAKTRESLAKGKAALSSCVALAEAASKFPAGHTREESLWRTLSCNLAADVPVGRAPAGWAIGWRMILRQYEMATTEGEIDKVRLASEFERDFMPGDILHFAGLASSITAYSTGRTLCVTTEGRLGYMPRESSIGDKICILLGSKVPFVIREASHERFKLIGECYIHGIMNGEAMEDGEIESLARDLGIE